MDINYGVKEIEFFDKDFDYDREFYENRLLNDDRKNDLGKKESLSKKFTSDTDIIRIWERGGPVKVINLPDFEENGIYVYPLYFINFQNYDYEQLKELLGNFFTLCEFENEDVRVTFRREDDLRVAYKTLKKDSRYKVKLDLIFEEGTEKKKNYVKHKKRDQNLISQWLNKGDVICETSTLNTFPILIRNYKHCKFDELAKLFSRYGKFTSIVHLENGSIQVKFSTEDEARECFKDLSKDKRYEVRILFFLKKIYNSKKLVRDIHPSEEEISVSRLLDAEDKIKFSPCLLPDEIPYLILGRKHRLKKEDKKTTSVSNVNRRIVYYPKNGKGHVYVEGIPLHNPYLSPPPSYLAWRDKHELIHTPLTDTYSVEKDINYEYYLSIKKGQNRSLLSSSQQQ